MFGLGLAAEGQTLQQINATLERISSSLFSAKSIFVLILCLTTGIVLGRLVAAVLRKVVVAIGRHADKTDDLSTVNRLRRFETIIVLSIAIIRTLLVLLALYFWWIFTHPNQQPTALIGASALLAIIIGGALSPALRDISSGSVMMAEQWYAVGDHVKIEPFGEMQGVVERVTLRSTRVRGLNGEVIWVNNQHIQAVRITPKGIRTLAIEVFVQDLDKGLELIVSTNRRLPSGALLVVSPLHVMTSDKVCDGLWHITAIAETAPGREWLIEKYALDVMKEIDETKKLHLLAAEPIARFADSDAERRFARAIENARKAPRKRSLRMM
ncbi:MAG TPA: mechanosensitive ion channel family protein, partial [Candidatus Limnocylindrales bacterium]|nr:mechanosensitive ion channel family protein [Candidatus Limnocylindrales bacterium]